MYSHAAFFIQISRFKFPKHNRRQFFLYWYIKEVSTNSQTIKIACKQNAFGCVFDGEQCVVVLFAKNYVKVEIVRIAGVNG